MLSAVMILYPLSVQGANGVAGVTIAEQQAQAKQRADVMQAEVAAPTVKIFTKQAKVSTLPPLPMEEEGFRIRQIVVESDDSFFQSYQAKVAPYEGYRIGPKGINVITRVLTEALTSDGYITTQVSVPDQDLTSGTLVLNIHPGRIERVRFTKTVAWGTWRNAFPFGEGDILNVRSLEQGLEQMKRVGNQDITMQLVPGSKPYTTIVELMRKESSPIQIVTSVDNGGYKETGQWEGSVAVSWYNPLGLNDIFSYTYGKDLEHEDNRLGSDNYYASYSIPYGWYTFNASMYRNHFRQTIATIQPYLSSGVTEGQNFGIERVLRRDSLSKTSLQVQVVRRERHNYIDGEEIDVQHQKTTAMELGIKHRQQVGRTQANIYGFVRKGIGGWGAIQQPWEDGVNNGTPRYTLWGLQLNLSSPIQVGHRMGLYTFRFVGQYAKQMLNSSDQLSIGGRYTVRGFDGERTLSGEYGAYIQNEWALPLKNGTFEPYIGLDVGAVGGPSTQYELGHVLVGSIFGVRGRLGNNVGYDVNIGTPIYKPQGFKTGKTTVGVSVYAQI